MTMTMIDDAAIGLTDENHATRMKMSGDGATRDVTEIARGIGKEIGIGIVNVSVNVNHVHDDTATKRMTNNTSRTASNTQTTAIVTACRSARTVTGKENERGNLSACGMIELLGDDLHVRAG